MLKHYRDGNIPWNPQYNIAVMDDGKEDCEICPVWRHTIGNNPNLYNKNDILYFIADLNKYPLFDIM